MNLSGTVNLTAGADYTLSFDVSGGGRTIVAGIGQSVAPSLGILTQFTLSATSQTIVMHLTAKAERYRSRTLVALQAVLFSIWVPILVLLRLIMSA